MKNKITKILSTVFLFSSMSALPCIADEKKPAEKAEPTKQILRLLKDAGLEDKQLAEISKALKGAQADVKPAAKPKVIRKTMVIGPDGIAKTLDSDDEAGIDLNMLLSGLKDIDIERLGDDDKADVKVSGKVSVIGPDGKVTSTEIDGFENLDVDLLLKEAMQGIDIDDIEIDSELLSVGPAVLLDSGIMGKVGRQNKTHDSEIKKLRKELAEQRKLLEEILEKLK